jgi:hypothetical protein
MERRSARLAAPGAVAIATAMDTRRRGSTTPRQGDAGLRAPMFTVPWSQMGPGLSG